MIIVEKIQFEGRNRLQVKTRGYIQRLPEKMRQIRGAFWKKEHGWLLPDTEETVRSLQEIFGQEQIAGLERNIPKEEQKEVALPPEREPFMQIPAHEEAVLKLTEQLMLSRYSYSTVKSYRGHFQRFLAAMGNCDLAVIEKETIRQYLLKQIREQKWSESMQNQVVNAIKFYYEKVLGQERQFYDLRPRRADQLPEVLSEEEVQKLLTSVKNLKHRCILSLIYSAGLRPSESVNVRLDDLLVDRKQIFIKAGKGKKDRYVILSDKIFGMLKKYQQIYKPRDWLFEGLNDERYSPRSVQQIMRRAVAESGINPFATVHTLRHSFATHTSTGSAQVC